MLLKHVIVLSGLMAALTVSAVGASAQAPAPRPTQPQPEDPAKPFPPPQDKTSPRPPAITVGVPSGGSAKEAPSKEDIASPGATSFIEEAGHDGAVETELAELAQRRAMRADVRAYAQMLLADHQKASDELMAMAARKNVRISTELTSTDKATVKKLEAANGGMFDRAFINLMVEDHTKAVNAFTAATANVDADVKTFAEKTLPVLRRHLQQAQKLAKGARQDQ